MATLVLSAAGAAIGGGIGGTVAGVGAAVIGRAAGAVAGSLIDQALFGGGSAPVEGPRASELKVQTSTEGAAIARVYGRMRVAGQVIWASNFLETVHKSGGGGGKGGPSSPSVREYSYSVSFAIGLCEGPIAGIGRVWMNGEEISIGQFAHALYLGSEDQAPDPGIESIDPGAPAYRGLAYIVFDDMPLERFGNAIPQVSVEVFRPAATEGPSLADLVKGVALSPGTGEFSLATEQVRRVVSEGKYVFENVNNAEGRPDILLSLDQLERDLPNCESISLVVTWFGDDLRCGQCQVYPAVDRTDKDTEPFVWKVSGIGRGSARKTSKDEEGRPNFGGAPSDKSVLQIIAELKSRGYRVLFYPFLQMDIPSGSGLPDPWGQGAEQGAFPWRGRITLGAAPGQPGSTDKTAAAVSEVASFFGAAAPGDFSASGDTVIYSGPAEWSYRRFILHYAALCAAAGGVDAFCIGSEMRSLTQIRSGPRDYPAVQKFQTLLEDVRSILGDPTKLGYAADWSEYFGHHPGDGSGDVLFHLDPLWAHAELDFIGVDNYAPMADWRDGPDHLDAIAGARSIYDRDYLAANIEGGENYDWYYANGAARDAQSRSPIDDAAHGEHWVFRPKDFRNWWLNPHHDRPGGEREIAPTAWQPQSKPIWLTEIGCPAVDLGANQPNIFYDPRSSEGGLPHYSRGLRDDMIQRRTLEAQLAHWSDPALNPVGAFGAPLIDASGVHVWTWDARPWPDFPQREEVWSDGPRHALGHWISGRVGSADLAAVVAEICARSGVADIDVAQLDALLAGYVEEASQTGRAALQPLMLAFGFDAAESAGRIRFVSRGVKSAFEINKEKIVESAGGDGGEGAVTRIRSPVSEMPSNVRFKFVDPEFDYQVGAVEAASERQAKSFVSESSAPLALTRAEAQSVAERWISELWLARDKACFSLAPSQLALEPGDVIALTQDAGKTYRLESAENIGELAMEAGRVDPAAFRPASAPTTVAFTRPAAAPAAPVVPVFMDLPLISGDEIPHQPHIAAFSADWPGQVAVYSSASEDGFTLSTLISRDAVIGALTADLAPAAGNRWSRALASVALSGGALQSHDSLPVLNGANIAAIERPDGEWEVIQFQTAALQPNGEYQLGGLLRGQSGTDGLAPVVIPAGARVVRLDGAARQIPLSLSARDLARHYRIGPATVDYTDASYVAANRAFQGVGLRPYAPAHLRARRDGAGDLVASWIRRARVGGDSWQGVDPPLGEAFERYDVRILQGAAVARSQIVETPAFTYSAADQAADGVVAPFTLSVRQISAEFGAGHASEITINE